MKYKKMLMLISLSLALTLSCPKEVSSLDNIEVEDEFFKKYSNGKVYIGSKEFINSLNDVDLENDVLVVDCRELNDPDMKIINSYAVDNLSEMKEIIHILKMYEQMNPSKWNRSEDAMLNEWLIHNLLYKLNYRLDRTTDVDFNNKDEKIYKFELKR